MHLSPILVATQTLLATIADKLVEDGHVRCPVLRDGETCSVPGPGVIYWDYVEEKSTDNTSEPAQSATAQITGLSILPLTVYCVASDFSRRSALEKAVLDILTPIGDDNRRHPYWGWSTVSEVSVEFHSIFHRSTSTIPGAKQGQDGPEVPALLLNFTAHIEVSP